MKIAAAVALASLGLCAWSPSPLLAQGDTCGPVPVLPAELEKDEQLKGQLQGQALALKGLIGRTELGGQIDIARTTIYKNSDSYFAAVKEAYLAYVFCRLLFEDKSIPFAEKINAFREITRLLKNEPRSLKDILKDGQAFVVEVEVPRAGTDLDKRFLKEVGAIVSFTLGKYDARTGRGGIASTSFGYLVDAFVVATDASLTIANSAPQSCAGSFQLQKQGLLRGRISCKWGSPYPSYPAVIRMGT